MSETAPESDQVIDQGLGLMPQDSQGQQPTDNQGQGQPNEEEIKFNQAWKPLLDKVPSQFHNMIAPDLKQWDRSYNEGLQKVHSQYAPWKPFIEQQVAPEDVNNALLIYNAMNEDPQALIGQLIEYYKYQLPQQGEQGQGDPQQQEPDDEGIPFDITQHPEFQRMAQLVELLGQNTLQQNEQILSQQAEEQLDQEFTQAKQKHGDFDETWVAQMMYVQGVDIDTAVQAYQQHIQQAIQSYRSPGQNAPVMMGGGGGLPSQQTPVGRMSDADRKKLVAETLARAAQQGG
jgi:hypothetical protein